MIKKYLALLSGLVTFFAASATPISYKTIGSIALQTEEVIKNEHPKNDLIPKDIRTIKLSQVSMTELEKRKLVYQLFDEQGTIRNNSQVINIDAINELNLVAGDTLTRKTNVLNKINKTETIFGDVVLSYLLSVPLADRKILETRQALIKELVTNDQLYQACNTLLKVIKKNETALLSFWKAQSPEQEKILECVYLKKNSLNTNEYALEASRLAYFGYNGLGYIHPLTLLFGLLNAGAEAGVKIQQGETVKPLEFVKGFFKNAWLTNKEAVLAHDISKLNKGYIEHLKTVELQESLGFSVPPFLKTKKYFYTASFAFTGLIDIWWAFRATQATKTLSFYNKVTTMLHQQMNDVAQLFKAMNELQIITNNNIILSSGIQSINALTTLCQSPQLISPELNKVINLFKTNTFSAKASTVSFVGRALAAYKIMPRIKSDFVTSLETIGELDAYMSIATIIRENQHTSHSYSFTEFIDSTTPEIELTDFTNPLINQSYVADSIHLGAIAGKPNLLLTGPHGCGKSTAMKAISYSLILSQTFGIAPAKAARITIFDNISTYLNIKENSEQKLSTFMAEALRIEQIESLLLNLDTQKKCFVILDEALKGTMEDEGAKRLYDFGSKIFRLPNNMCIMATHFEKISDLENALDKKVINYHVGLEEPQLGSFIRTFKLIPGKNNWWFEDADKRTRFIDWLTATA
ncbi:hypothetical protein Noda2021_04380 [Candidatus Dependentiae bacterium Noda2021]|nr:hypothetical protein Noda2021_04380 [Candidatus Dependentiae bacterium Noda2021]